MLRNIYIGYCMKNLNKRLIIAFVFIMNVLIFSECDEEDPCPCINSSSPWHNDANGKCYDTLFGCTIANGSGSCSKCW